NSLAATLGVNHKTVVRALEELESEGILVSQGPRRGRLIALSGEAGPKPMRIGILTYEFVDREESSLSGIHHALSEVGHIVSYAGKSLTELKMDVKKVARFVEGQDLDAWVVVAGSRLILEWFCEQPLPVFALFGRRENLPIAGTGPRSDLAFSEAVHRLIGLGHRRVVHICRGDRRKPNPGKSEQKFLEILASHGLPVAHLRWDTMGVVRRVVRWAATVSHGHSDIRNSYTPTTFVDGGTVGPVPSDLRGA
ncbi:GntR family transcriptional regulator, partial [Akkermansiaceae bacterium]|nr:GntR family transcriptional regulator [Akkermansiaceae bacterium]